jgi:uncharacterized membrane protein
MDASVKLNRQGRFSPRVAGILCYLIGPLVLLFEREAPTVRFHAAQASLLAGSLAVLNLSLAVLTAAAYRHSWDLGVRASAAVSWIHSAEIVLWLVLLYFAYELTEVSVPTIGAVAKRLATTEKADPPGASKKVL